MIRDDINEAIGGEREVDPKFASNSVTHRDSKIRKSVSQMATGQARKRNDPLYKTMIRYRELYFRYRTLVHRKYGKGVDARARR
jgi:hypothetical protein